jgi:hypothetical protein
MTSKPRNKNLDEGVDELDEDDKLGGKGATAALAEQAIAEGKAKVVEYGAGLLDDRSSTATQAARVLADILAQQPELIVPLVDKFAIGVASQNKRVAQTSADALPAIAKLAPARVAKHLDRLKSCYGDCLEPGKDGLMRTFAALCAASVAYQKRLEPVIKKGLGEADGKTLRRWTELVLPALKGEPHANARAVVEARLERIPRAHAQKIADFLGIRLRPK